MRDLGTRLNKPDWETLGKHARARKTMNVSGKLRFVDVLLIVIKRPRCCNILKLLELELLEPG